MLQPGTEAPDFTLRSTLDDSFTLSENRGKKVILAFYPADWSPVCTDQMVLYNELVDFFSLRNATVVGISVDGRWCHQAFSDDRRLDFSLLSDFEPKGFVARRYQVYDEDAGESRRALFLIDENGTIRWSFLSPNDVNPGADGILRALDDMSDFT